MTRSYTKSQRLNALQIKLSEHFEEGISKADLADYFGVDRSTIVRDMQDLEEDNVPISEVAHGLYGLDPEYLRYNLSLTNAESLVLYLAARRVARQSSNAIAPILTALDKLASGLRQPLMDALREALNQTRTLPANPDKQTAFEQLAQAWLRRRWAEVWYRGLHSLRVHSYIFAPYIMEPSPWGEGTYVVGVNQARGTLLTLKLERVERVRLTGIPFEVPEAFDQNVLLRHAWGVWMGEGDLDEVVLRFSPYVARRVRETRWHPTERLRDLPNGGIEWRAEVSESQEMLPWIRGWGADVEVIAPEALRQALRVEVQRLMRLYGESQGVDEYGLPT